MGSVQTFLDRIEIVKKPAPLPTPITMTASEESLQAAAKEFKSWLRDWRTTASAGIVRRDYRIMLGISRRRSTPDAPEQEPVPEPPPLHAQTRGLGLPTHASCTGDAGAGTSRSSVSALAREPVAAQSRAHQLVEHVHVSLNTYELLRDGRSRRIGRYRDSMVGRRAGRR